MCIVGWSVVVMVTVMEVIMMVPIVLPVTVVVTVVSPSVMVVVMAPISVVFVMVVIMMEVVVLSVVWCIWMHNSLGVLGLLFLLSWLWSSLFLILLGWLLGLLSILGVHVSFIVERNSIHLLTKEDLGEGKTKGVSKLVVVLVFPLSHGVHHLVVDILSIHDEVMVNVEDEVPWVGESL